MSRTSVKLRFPEFTSDITLYLTLIENYFTHLNINNPDQKFRLLSCNLPPEVVSQLRDVLLDDNIENKYEFLCQSLTRLYAGTSLERINSILHLTYENDVRQMWLKLQILTPDMPPAIVRDIFLAKLPPTLRLHALTQKNLSNNELIDSLQTAASIMDIPPPLQGSLSPLRTEIDNLSSEMRQLRLSLSTPTQSPVPSTSKNFSTSSTITAAKPLCYYHRNFGSRAVKCSPPCSFVRLPKNE